MLATAGKDNAAWSPVIDAVPATRGGNSPEVTGLTLTSLLPDSLGHYAYDGSLTTPPCSEGVRWLLLQTPIDSGDMFRGVIQSLVYVAIFTALGFRHFARRDVTS